MMVLIIAARGGGNARGLYDAAFLRKLIGRNVASVEPMPETGGRRERADHQADQ